MLNRLLRKIESSQGTVRLNDLSRKLGNEHSALDGMIQFWVRKGRLVDDGAAETQAGVVCSIGSCGASCMGTSNCALVAKMPKTYSISPGDIE